jgi:hypothetical protein
MSETLETVLRASVRTLAAAAGLSPSRMHQPGKLTVLQTLPRKAVTSANAAGAPGLRTYLTHDESRHHRVSGPIAPIHERAASPASARTGRARGSRGYRLGRAVSLGICAVRADMSPDLRGGLAVSVRDRPLVTGVNGTLMARRHLVRPAPISVADRCCC